MEPSSNLWGQQEEVLGKRLKGGTMRRRPTKRARFVEGKGYLSDKGGDNLKVRLAEDFALLHLLTFGWTGISGRGAIVEDAGVSSRIDIVVTLVRMGGFFWEVTYLIAAEEGVPPFSFPPSLSALPTLTKRRLLRKPQPAQKSTTPSASSRFANSNPPACYLPTRCAHLPRRG
jgi:hypothetical protein